MPEKREMRRKERVSYHVADDSDSLIESSSSNGFATPRKHRRALYEDSEDDEVEPAKTPPPRVSSGTHVLRQRKDLHPSLRAQENGDQQRRKRTRTSKSSRFSLVKSDAPSPDIQMSARNEVRNEIATETARKRANFFVAKKEYFLPLLPESNHIKRLVDERSKSEDGGIDLSVPYEAIDHQPQGVKATMKPYQLGGLSFLLYLNRNGLSGVLGDEMGLGKTLQTLSLIQYLKENRKKVGTRDQPRPCLVVCPLSVLSSWIAEARRWTPELKVLRFHGPVRERARLKRIAAGEEDMYGNETNSARRKKNGRRAATGKLSNPDQHTEDLVDEPTVDLIVTTYEGYQAEQNWFKRAFVWSYVILDEGHKIKNDLSLISKSLQGLGAEYRLILTGTPLQNNMVELWALLHWLYPEVFIERTAELFKKAFNLTRGEVSTTVMDDARRLLELIMLRRMKNSKGVDLNLPPKTDVLLFVPLTPMQRFWYSRLLTRADDGLLEELFQGAKAKEEASLRQEDETKTSWINKDIKDLEALESGEGGTAVADWEESKAIMRQAIEQEKAHVDTNSKSDWKKLMNLLMQLRKCCNHPYLLPRAEPTPYYLGNHIIHASAKFILLEKIINELVVKQRRKVLIFSGFTRMLDCCEDFMALRGGDGDSFRYLRLDGGTGRARRNLGIRMFNKEDSNYLVMLISTRAGGLGINLATASDVIMLDQDWNPQIMLQAEARAHRIGQTKPVTVYKLCTQGTVEEQMMGRIQKKLYLSAKVTEGMRDIHTESPAASKKRGPRPSGADEDMPQLDTSQLVSLVRRGAQALAHPELDIDEMLGWDWPTMLEKCKDKPADIHISEQTKADAVVREEDEKKWLSQIEQIESRVFQGKRYSKKEETRSYNDIQQEWSRAERRKGKNTTVMVDGYAVSKESMQCGDWEAVPTFAGKDPRLAEPKREKKKPLANQEHCQVCWDGGDLVLCSGCPRSYHYACLDKDSKTRSKGKINFSCPQHQCADCEQKTGDAGGMLFRCRWCESGYCEDCLDWEKTKLIGENLKEFDLLSFGPVTQAFYICCPSCNDYHAQNHDAKEFCDNMAFQYDLEHEQFLKEQVLVTKDTEAATLKAAQPPSPPSRAESLTDATTLDTLDNSGISTPQFRAMDHTIATHSHKRKVTLNLTPCKRVKVAAA